ncbi:phospholipase D-like domain-containing protein [Actinomadura atramentaria]|uniref:phospholipase D-like domain-containing protein n=1 Tax=Actinomadura atramentaria TaxID=1990 RepID=UPI00037E4C5E|nr:phospholipase D-like domain-containing protein [Actinomadura atramentaria]
MRALSFVVGGLLTAAAVASLETAAAGGASAALAAKPNPKWLKPAQTPWQTPRTYVAEGPRFNTPTGGVQQAGELDLYIKKLIRATPKGAEIDVALFRLQTTAMARYLVEAHQRGVKVRIVLDTDTLSKKPETYTTLKKALGTNTSKSSWVTLCPKNEGCIARGASSKTWAKNHNKFYAFSKTYDSKNVVVQTSGNATGGMYNQFNDAYTMTDAKLYGAYRSYFYDLAKKTPNTNYWRTVTSGSRSVSFFPKTGSDPIVDVLNRVSCVGGTKIRLSSGLFTRTAVARKLSALDAAGCDVRIATGSIGESVAKALQVPGLHGGPTVHYFSGGSAHPAHSKYLLIDGIYGGKKTSVVLTGSHSYTVDALRNNDEAMLTLQGSAIYNAYAANFEKVYAQARGVLEVGTIVPPPIVSDDTAGDDENDVPGSGAGAQATPPDERPAPDPSLPPTTEQPDGGPDDIPLLDAQ